jgi:hypothetical protein
MSVSTANGSVTVTPQDAEGASLIALEANTTCSQRRCLSRRRSASGSAARSLSWI